MLPRQDIARRESNLESIHRRRGDRLSALSDRSLEVPQIPPAAGDEAFVENSPIMSAETEGGDVKSTRRELLAGAGAGAAALLLDRSGLAAQAPASRAIVFSHTTVVTVDAVQDDVALAVQGDKIAAIGATDAILANYRGAEVYDGRGKALVPGLINCHAHLAATLARGFNEDFGFPNSAKLSVQPTSLVRGEEATLMVTVGALEAIRTGTTTIVENSGGIARHAKALADTGLRCVFAESIRDTDNVAGPMATENIAGSPAPRFSPKLRDEGMQRISDLFAKWHGANDGRITVFPAAALAETSSPELLQAVRAFAEQHDLGYTIHLSQSRAEVDFMVRHHRLRPPAFLDRHGFLGPRLFAAHCRYVDDGDIALLGRSATIVSHQAAMAANRGVIPPIPALRAAGCPIANGTDNNTNDLFEVMRVALLTERIRRDDANPGLRPQPEDMLEDATLGGARAVGQPKRLGALEVGRKADVLVVDTLRAHLVPAGRFVSAWIHNGQPSDIESVMVDGRFVMRDRRILTADEPAIVAEADKVGRRIWNQVKAAGAIEIPGRGAR
jgi:5-methylthioadenosine/S-adenosylhomocysteine deaminase